MFELTKNVVNFKNQEKVVSFEQFYQVLKRVPLFEYLVQNNIYKNEHERVLDFNVCVCYGAKEVMHVLFNNNREVDAYHFANSDAADQDRARNLAVLASDDVRNNKTVPMLRITDFDPYTPLANLVSTLEDELLRQHLKTQFSVLQALPRPDVYLKKDITPPGTAFDKAS